MSRVLYGGAAARDSIPVSAGGSYRPRALRLSGGSMTTMSDGTKRLVLLGGALILGIGAVAGFSWLAASSQRSLDLRGLGRGRRRRSPGRGVGGDTLKRYRITYRDPDPAAPDFTTTTRAYDRDHAEEKFIESNDGDDWRIVKIEQVGDDGRPLKRRRR